MLLDLVTFFYLCLAAPFLIWRRIFKGKKHPGVLNRLGYGLAQIEKDAIWIHAVSLGEVKAAAPLYQALKAKYPFHSFAITVTTEAGFHEAKRSLKDVDFISYAPIDFSWTVKRFIQAINPAFYIVIESDFWPNLLTHLKKRGIQTALVSGKLSEKSFKRFLKASFFSKRLLQNFDLICTQNELYQNRFKLVSGKENVFVTGNLKFDLSPSSFSHHLDFPQNAVVISCTHSPEEELILEALEGTDFFLILVPRHPERFKEVEALLLRKKIAFTKWEEREKPFKRVFLANVMGELPSLYSKARLSILGGSFVAGIGGHNILEPLLYNTPVFFGPFMEGQLDFAACVLRLRAGRQVSLENLKQEVEHFFSNKKLEEEMKMSGETLLKEGRGATERTLNALIFY